MDHRTKRARYSLALADDILFESLQVVYYETPWSLMGRFLTICALVNKQWHQVVTLRLRPWIRRQLSSSGRAAACMNFGSMVIWCSHCAAKYNIRQHVVYTAEGCEEDDPIWATDTTARNQIEIIDPQLMRNVKQLALYIEQRIHRKEDRVMHLINEVPHECKRYVARYLDWRNLI